MPHCWKSHALAHLVFVIDEEYARQLQEEQDLSERRGPRRVPKVSTPRIIPLKEIMEEEMTKQSTQEELVCSF